MSRGDVHLVKFCTLCGVEFNAYKRDDLYCDRCRDDARREKQRRTNRAALPALTPVSFVREHITKAPDGQRIVIVSDLQHPFIDWKTWAGVTRFITDFQPNIIVWNGDIGDFYGISSFDKNPQRTFTFSDEMVALRRFLEIGQDAWHFAKHYFIMGNHEHRMEWFLKRTPELSGLIDIDSVLKLKENGFILMPYGGVLDYLGFAITHGTRYSSLPNGTARQHAQMIGGSGCVGHSHRIGQWTYTDMRGTHTFHETGCLCRLDPDYIPQRPPNWQQGFMAGIAHNNAVHLHQMSVYEDGFYGAFTGAFYARK